VSLFSELKRRNVIRVAIAYLLMGWVVLQGADFALDLIGAPEWVIRALAIVALVGLPFALAFSWAFEMTPEGIKREAEVNRDESIAPATGQKLNGMIIALLVLAVALLLVDRYRAPRTDATAVSPTAASPGQPSVAEPTGAAASQRSVAVLPFRAMSSGEDDEYFADGLTEEILNSLAQVPGLSVTSRTSAFYFKDKDLPIAKIAEQLGVAHVVEGSVRRSGDRLRVTAQLIRTEDDTHLWSNNYDSTDADAIEVQEDIARQIAETLNVFLDDDTLARMRRAGIRDVDAFIEYARGVDMHIEAHGHDDQLEMLEAANAHMATAIEAAPGFSAAWVFYSDYYTHLLVDAAMGELRPRPDATVLEAAQAEAENAFQQAARHAPNAGVRAAAELDLAILRGDAEAWRPLLDAMLNADGCLDYVWAHLLGLYPEFRDRYAELLERLVRCDPMAINNWGDLVEVRIAQGRPEDALKLYERFPSEGNDLITSSEIHALLALGRAEAAESVAAIDMTSDGSRYVAKMLIAATKGDADRVLALRDDMLKNMPINDFRALLIAAWVGDRAAANGLAARIDAQPMGHLALMISLVWCNCGAPFELGAAPRLAEIWQRAGLPWPIDPVIEFPLKDW